MGYTVRSTFALIFSLVLLISALPSSACGPFFQEAIFSYDVHPDFPLKRYAAGELGIIRDKFARSYLVVAYRNFTDKPLTAPEQKGAIALWHHRLYNSDANSDDAVKTWFDTRKLTGAPKPEEIYTWRAVNNNPDSSFAQYDNCPPSAFLNASNTLKQRITRYGAGSQEVKEWVQGQDLVFCHCSSPAYDFNLKKNKPEPPFPAPLKAGSDAQLQADRTYQIAAAHFYGQQFKDAENEFEAIAKDGSSPWNRIAPYMVVRSLIRQGTLADPLDKSALSRAEAKIAELTANPTMDSLKSELRKLQGFIDFRLNPEKRLVELSAALQDPLQAADFENNLFDYTLLIDNLTGESVDFIGDDDVQKKELPAALLNDEMTSWLLSFEKLRPNNKGRALQRWKDTKKVEWLVSALTTEDIAGPDYAGLAEAAQKIPAKSSAYLSANYHSVRYLIGQKRNAEAQAILDKVLAAKDLPPSSRNLLLDQQKLLAKSFDKFLALSAQSPAGASYDIDMQEVPDEIQKIEASSTYPSSKPLFPESSAAAFNTLLPLDLLVAASKSMVIPARLRGDLIQSTWVRAVMLNQMPTATALVPLLEQFQPALAPLVSSYAAPASADVQKFRAIYLMLKNPGMRPYVTAGLARQTEVNRIDDFGDNWWCATTAKKQWGDQKKSKPQVSFLTPAQATTAATELKILQSKGPGANYLANEVLTYARKYPKDPLVPEALSMTVKATRFGCTDAQTTNFSKQAFQLLHKTYPASSWTKKTPYHY